MGKKKKRLCLQGLTVKEVDDSLIVEGLVATTHPDRVNDILSENALTQIVSKINDIDLIGDDEGSYRSVSLFHDWIHESDPSLDEVAFLKPTAEMVSLDDGHKGVKVTAEINKFYKGEYKGEPITPEEIKYRIDNGQIAGFSIEYNTDDDHSRDVDHKGESYRFIEELTEFGGVGLARARMIANPHAVIYKEIAEKVRLNNITKKGDNMADEKPIVKEGEEPEKKDEAPKEDVKVEEPKVEEKETKPKPEFDIKEISKELKEAVKEALEVKPKVLKQTKEDVKTMETKEIPLCVKEMQESLSKGDSFSYKEAGLSYLRQNPEFDMQYKTTGIPLITTIQTKCEENTWDKGMGCGKLRMIGGLPIKEMMTKDTLDTTTNTSTYTQNIVEFADVYVPGIIDTFNNQTNLTGALPKKDNVDGSNKYGWRITTSQQSSLSVDPDVTTVDKEPVLKLKLQTPIREYRLGVSVSDYTLYHSRAAIGDLFMIEVEKTMRDVMKDINKDLFTEQADTAGVTDVIGLEAVADSAGNTSLYGLTRSTTNRLAPAAAADTYLAIGHTLHTTALRTAAQKVEVEGAARGNLRYIMNPTLRTMLYNLEETKIRYMNEPNFGFFGGPAFDGVPVIVDPDCQVDAFFCVDFESEYLVMSKAPQLHGLAKVGAAEEAFISVYLAHVYEQPRRIYMGDTVT